VKFNYEAYKRLFPRHEVEKVRAEIRKEREQGNVLEEVEKPAAKQEPVREDIIPDLPSDSTEEGGVVDAADP
jgi:hypothetical protein